MKKKRRIIKWIIGIIVFLIIIAFVFAFGFLYGATWIEEELGTGEEGDVKYWNFSTTESFKSLESAIKDDLKTWEEIMDHCLELVVDEPYQVQFEYLKEKGGALYSVDFDCTECDPDCMGGDCCPSKTEKYLEKDGKFYRIFIVERFFPEMFEDLETIEQALEYWDFVGKRRLQTLDEAREVSMIDVEDTSACNTDIKLEKLNPKVILKKEGNNFVYEGFFGEPFSQYSTIDYVRYTISPQGGIDNIEETQVEECETTLLLH